MNINCLPDDVLRHIFSRLPLLDQVHLHHVCPRWKSLQSSVTSTRKSLTLFIGERNEARALSLITESTLTIPYLDQIESGFLKQASTLELTQLYYDLTEHLLSLFPNISSLCVVLINETGYETLDQVILLLECWSKSLVSLSFYCHFDEEENEYYYGYTINHNEISKRFHKMIRIINQHCLALECLTFDVNLALYDWTKAQTPNLDLPCLARLREFKFCCWEDGAAILFSSLKKYGTSDQLKAISIGNFVTPEESRDFIAEFVQHPRTAAKFASLRYFEIPIDRFATFNSLTTLKIQLIMSLPKLSESLSPLHSLIYLRLTIYSTELSQYDSTPTYDFHAVPSVKILSLYPTTRSHTALASRHWSTIFPSIQLVEVCTVGVFCEACSGAHIRLGSMQPNHKVIAQIDRSIEQDKNKQCLKMLLAPMTQFDKLKKIVTRNKYPGTEGGEKKEWTIEELIN